MKRSVLFAALLAAISLSAPDAWACTMTIQEKQAIFVSYDRNRDQRLDALEYQAGETNRLGPSDVEQEALRNSFNMMDSTGRGLVGPEDFQPIPDQKCMQEGQIAY